MEYTHQKNRSSVLGHGVIAENSRCIITIFTQTIVAAVQVSVKDLTVVGIFTLPETEAGQHG